MTLDERINEFVKAVGMPYISGERREAMTKLLRNVQMDALLGMVKWHAARCSDENERKRVARFATDTVVFADLRIDAHQESISECDRRIRELKA